METIPEDLFETVKARIVSGDERQMVGVFVSFLATLNHVPDDAIVCLR